MNNKLKLIGDYLDGIQGRSMTAADLIEIEKRCKAARMIPLKIRGQCFYSPNILHAEILKRRPSGEFKTVEELWKVVRGVNINRDYDFQRELDVRRNAMKEEVEAMKKICAEEKECLIRETLIDEFGEVLKPPFWRSGTAFCIYTAIAALITLIVWGMM